MQINIISDGLFGKRAFENIGRQFSCRWVTVPYSGSPIMEDVEIELPPSDLCISYARHPDVILTIVEQGVPVRTRHYPRAGSRPPGEGDQP